MKRTCTKHAFAAHLTRSLFGTCRRRTAFFKALTVLVSLDMMLLGALPVLALPQGGTVKSGDVTFDDASAGTLIVNQASGKASIDWSGGFNIGASELVKFVQPGSSSVAVNRDSSGSLSEIWGNLQANGQIYLLNPNGILFGSGSSVNVGGLIAAAMNSMEGGYGSDAIRFSGGGGSVTVQGGASISAGKYAYLIGSVVDNAGSISAGDVILAAGAGDSIELVREPDGSTISIVIGGTPQDASETAGGDVASGENPAAEDPAEGLAQGTVQNTGVINASGEIGGNVQMQASDIVHTGSINADGATGAGGVVTMQASANVLIGAESVTTANAGLDGDGGSIFIVAERSAVIEGGATIEARGGGESGDGGFVETSGHESIEVGAMPDVAAPQGNGGTWLIDPTDITIAAGTSGGAIPGSPVTANTLYADDISAFLGTGNLVVTTTSPDPDVGDITWLSGADILWAGANSLTLEADGGITVGGTATAASGSLILDAAGAISLDNAINVSALTMTGASIAQTAGTLSAGDVAVNATGNVTLGSLNDFDDLSGTAASMTVNDVDGLALGNVVTTGNLTIHAGGPLTDTAAAVVMVAGATDLVGGNITLANALNDFQGNVVAHAGGSLELVDANAIVLQDVDTANGSIEVTAGGQITATDVASLTDNDANDITLTGVGIAVGSIVAGAGAAADVILDAGTGAICDQQNDTVGHNADGFATQTGDARAVNIVADQLKMTADDDIGVAGNPLDTTVKTLAANSANGSVYVYETDALTIGTVDGMDGVNAATHAKVETINGTLTVDQAVTATAGDVLLAAKNGAIDVNALVSGQNVAVVATGDVTEDAAVDATGNKVIVSKTGDIVVNATSAQAQNVMYKAEAGSVSLNADVTAVDTLGIEAGQGDLTGLTIAARNLLLRATTGGIDLDVGDAAVNLAAASGRDLDIDVAGDINIVNAGDFTVRRPTLDDVGANETIRGTSGATAGDDLALAVEGDLSATTVASGGDADVAVGGNMEVGNVEVGNDLALEVGSALDADDIAAGGDAGIVVGGDMDAGSVVAGGSLEIESGDLTFDEMKAKSIVVDAGNIAMGQVSAGTAEFKAGGNITDNDSSVVVNTLAMIASGNIGSGSSPIDMTTRTIRNISGGNVYLRENASGSVTLGSISARGELELAAPNIGMPGGDGGFIDGNGDANNIVAGGDVLLDIAGFFGQPNNPMELAIDGKLDLKSGGLHGEQTQPSWIYFIYNGEPLRPEYVGDGSIPGLIIANNRVVGGHPDLVRKMNRALAFTVDTPELKSKQGVFGDVNFIHTDLDVSDANSIGVLDYLESEASDWGPLDYASVWDAQVGESVRLGLRSLERWGASSAFDFEVNVQNPSGLNEVYTEDLNSPKRK